MLVEGLKDEDGDTEGLMLGESETDGETEGEIEGLILGLKLGDKDGESDTLGETEGLIDKLIDGEILKEILGEIDGLILGEIEALGLTLGLIDGEIEGLILGDTDSEMLGDIEGTIPASQASPLIPLAPKLKLSRTVEEKPENFQTYSLPPHPPWLLIKLLSPQAKPEHASDFVKLSVIVDVNPECLRWEDGSAPVTE